MSREMFRRSFLKLSSVLPLPALPTRSDFAQGIPVGSPGAKKAPMSVAEFLAKLTYTREQVATFLDPDQPNWATFDPELGYLLRNNILKDGVDGCRTILSFQKFGQRTMVNYAHQPCRLNAYGDSFTEGAQVSDGETWSEYLAAHFGEPVRNFGVGGYGVYQAYRRMLREEATPSTAQFMILNIWGIDDHLRSIDAWRWLRVGESWRTQPRYLQGFLRNPWAHIRLDLKTGGAIELENPYPSPESLYKLCDNNHVYQQFRDDLVVQLLVAQRMVTGVNLGELKAWAAALGLRADFSSPEATARTASALHVEYGLRSSRLVIEKAQAFALEKKKRLMVLLSYDDRSVMRACQGLPRTDEGFVDFLKQTKVPFVDLLTKHVEDFKSFNLSPRDYANRYFIGSGGHYKPQGNHFLAFAIKDAIADWLNPKPIAYREGSETIPP